MFIHVYVHTCTSSHIQYMNSHIHNLTHTHNCVTVSTLPETLLDSNTQISIHQHIYILMYTCTHVHTYSRIRSHSDTKTGIFSSFCDEASEVFFVSVLRLQTFPESLWSLFTVLLLHLKMTFLLSVCVMTFMLVKFVLQTGEHKETDVVQFWLPGDERTDPPPVVPEWRVRTNGVDSNRLRPEPQPEPVAVVSCRSVRAAVIFLARRRGGLHQLRLVSLIFLTLMRSLSPQPFIISWLARVKRLTLITTMQGGGANTRPHDQMMVWGSTEGQGACHHVVVRRQNLSVILLIMIIIFF